VAKDKDDFEEFLAQPSDLTKALMWKKYYQVHGCERCGTKEGAAYGGCALCERCLREIEERFRSLNDA
jgi:hypothetical protein